MKARKEKIQQIMGLIEAVPGITGKQLRENTGMSRRTLYTILRVLVKEEKIIERQALSDARQFKYYLSPVKNVAIAM